MRYILTINGKSFGDVISEDGADMSREIRNEKSVITMDGSLWEKSVSKHKIDVSLLDMSDTQYRGYSLYFSPNPADVVFMDLEGGRSLSGKCYIKDIKAKVKKVIGTVTYLTDIGFSIEQK